MTAELDSHPAPQPPPTPSPSPGGRAPGTDPLVERLVPIAVRIPACAASFFGLKPEMTEKYLAGGLTPEEIAALRDLLDLAEAGSDAAALLGLLRRMEDGDWTPAITALELLKPGPLVCAEGLVEIFLPGQLDSLNTCLKGQTETARECRRLIFEQLNVRTSDPGPIGQPQPDLAPPFLPGTVPARFVGSWSGSITQAGLAPYPFSLAITGGAVGSTVGTGSYDTLGCTVHWTLTATETSSIVVREIVDSGSNCVDVDITLALNSDDTARYTFEAAGGGRGILQRQR